MQGRDGHLKQGVAPVDQDALAEDDIRFFVTKNPGYVEGDELVCLGLVDKTFVLAYARKRIARVIFAIGQSMERTWQSRPASS